MTRLFSTMSATALLVLGACASYPAPVQQLAPEAEAAARTAQESGADADPQAQLHLRLAQEGIARAKQLMADGDNQRADSTVTRARSDAGSWRWAEARTDKARAEAQKALDHAARLQASGPTTTTSVTTTSATIPAPPPPPPETAPPTTTTTTQSSGGKP